MSNPEEFYKSVTGWILEAAIQHPDTKLSDLFKFSEKDGGLLFEIDTNLIKEWRANRDACVTANLEDPEGLAKWQAYMDRERAFYASKGIKR